MADEPIANTPADNAVDAGGEHTPPIKEPKDRNGAANIPTPAEFSLHATTIPSSEELFSKQEDDVSNLILKLPRTIVPDFSVKLYRRRQLDWARYERAIGSTTGVFESKLPSQKTLSALQTTAAMGTLQFAQTVGYNYMRKSLALMYHQTSLMKTLNTNLVSLGKVLEAKLEAIKLNTALPESKKAGFLARFKNEFRDQSIRAAVTNIRGKISDAVWPRVHEYVTTPAAQVGANFFGGKESLSDIARHLQMGLRNATQTAAEKLSPTPPSDGGVGTPLSAKVASALSRLSTRIGDHKPSAKMTDRLDTASGWLRSHLPSDSFSSFFDSFLGREGTPESTGAESASGGFDTGTSAQTTEFYNDSRTYYDRSLALLEQIAGERGSPRKSRPKKTVKKSTSRTRPVTPKRPSHARPKATMRPAPKPPATPHMRPKATVRPTPKPHMSAQVTPDHFAAVMSRKPSSFIRDALASHTPKPSPATPHVRPVIPTALSLPHITPSASQDTPSQSGSTPSHDDINPPQRSHTQRPHSDSPFTQAAAEAVDAEFSDVDSAPKNSWFASLRDDLRRYASTTASLLSGFMKHDKTITDSTRTMGDAFKSVQDALLRFIPKPFRKNSYEDEVKKDDAEEAALHDRETKTANETAGNDTGGELASLIKNLFKKGGGEGKDDRGGDSALDDLADIGELAADVGVAGWVLKKLRRTRVGRGLIKTAKYARRPLRAASRGLRYVGGTLKDKGLLRGGLSLGGKALGAGLKSAWWLAKSPFKALGAADKLLRPIDAKAMTLLGSAGRGIGHLAKGALLSKGGLVGLGGLAVNNLTDHFTGKNTIMNRLGHTTGDAMEWGATGAMLGSFLAPGVGTAIGAGIGVTAAALITNLDLLGKGIHAAGRGLTYLYHGIVGENPVIDPNGKLLKPGKAGLLSGLAFASQYTQEQLLGKQKATLGFDPNAKPWIDNAVKVTPYTGMASKAGINPSSTLLDPTTLKNAYAGTADTSATLNNQKVTDQKGYQDAFKLLDPDIQKKVSASPALQLTLWGTSVVNGPTDTAKIFKDNFNPTDTEATYIRKIYQTRSTRFGGKSGADRQKAFQELVQESEYANAISSGTTTFSFSKANDILGDPVKPLADGSGDMSAYTAQQKISGSTAQRVKQAMQFFQSKGWTAAQAAGIVGNLVQESGVNPQVKPGDNGTAFGIAQWHRDRRGPIEAAFGKPITQMTLTEQLEAVNWELHNTEKAAGQALKNTTNATQAGRVVSAMYERPGNTPTIRAQEAYNRGSLANQIFTAQASQGSSPNTAAPQNTLLASTAPTQNNSASPQAATSAPSTEPSPSLTQTASASPAPTPNPSNGTISTAPVSPIVSPTFTADNTKNSPEIKAATTSFVKSTTGPVIMRTADNGPSEVDKIRKGEFIATVDRAVAGKTYNPNSKENGYIALARNQIQSDALNTAIDNLTKQIAANTEASKAQQSTKKGDTLVVNQSQNNNTVHIPYNDLDLSKPGTRSLTI